MGSAFIDDWRNYATRHRLTAAVVAGLVATHVTTNLGMWYHGIGLPDLNFNYLNGLLVFGNSGQATTGMQDPVILTFFGAAAHYSMGVAFALVFAFGISPLLPIASTLMGNFAKAIIWGLILATISCVWWINLFPNLFGPDKSAGIFFANAGPDQLKWIVAVYLWHLVYGFNLGAFYQPKDIPTAQVAQGALAA